jgi:hypothetical protein
MSVDFISAKVETREFVESWWKRKSKPVFLRDLSALGHTSEEMGRVSSKHSLSQD